MSAAWKPKDKDVRWVAPVWRVTQSEQASEEPGWASTSWQASPYWGYQPGGASGGSKLKCMYILCKLCWCVKATANMFVPLSPLHFCITDKKQGRHWSVCRVTPGPKSICTHTHKHTHFDTLSVFTFSQGRCLFLLLTLWGQFHISLCCCKTLSLSDSQSYRHTHCKHLDVNSEGTERKGIWSVCLWQWVSICTVAGSQYSSCELPYYPCSCD